MDAPIEPERRSLQPRELEAADILLSRGEGPIAEAIVAADGGNYSHAALWSGSSVIEAREDGVRERPLTTPRAVYRYVDTLHPLRPADRERIVAIARSRVGNDYAFAELYLLGSLVALGARPRRSLASRVLSLLGGARAEKLEAWLTSLGGDRRPVICSEFVALAYQDAAPDQRFALRILPPAARPAAPEQLRTRARSRADLCAEDAALERVAARCRELVAMSSALAPERTPPVRDEARRPERKVLFGTVARDAVTGARLGVVSPADLQFSPSLRLLGCVSAPSQAAGR